MKKQTRDRFGRFARNDDTLMDKEISFLCGMIAVIILIFILLFVHLCSFLNISMLNKNEKTDPYIMIKEKLNEHEKRINDLEIIANDLKEKAKAKLKLGKKECAKRILSKKRKYLGQIKLIEDAV